MNTSHEIRAFLFCCLLFQMAQPARAQLEGKIVYPEFYAFHPGDDTTWAQPEFDDRDWEKIKYGTFPRNRWHGIGWFRFVFEVDSNLWNKPLGLAMLYAGAVDFYLDGELLYRFGKVGASKDQEDSYIDPRPRPRVIIFRAPSDAERGKSRHLVAIRYSSFFLESPIASGARPGFGLDIDDLDRMIAQRDDFRRTVSIHQMLLMGVLLALALLHALLFWFYPRLRPNLYFAVLSAFMALTIYFWFQEYLTTSDPMQYVWDRRLEKMALTLTTLSLIRLVYSLMYSKTPKMFVPFVFIGLGVTLWYWFRPFIAAPYLFLFYPIGWAETVRVIVVPESRNARRCSKRAGLSCSVSYRFPWWELTIRSAYCVSCLSPGNF